ncbi:hypothetical protein B0T18DRAFT_367467 [Schizothecium vesticola]|uniref:Cellobiose dehydrogenase-like cytochrome domain-containing protein n=1 Tax=Schizothecium vesticola TaxID=314040 RepID=A0AA40EUJ1_9PEZI|nr:hypothetical protein B0T18DRAFT_367467 [Schizothecium vesticola]
MHLLPLLATLATLTTALPSTSLLPRQSTTTRICNPTTSLCHIQLSPGSPDKPLFRIALPDTPSPPYDIILEIVSPTSLTWTGFAWGGKMLRNPLTVVWPNGDDVMVSSRWTTFYGLPRAYPSATYKTLRSSRNGTHWSVEVACSGCSQWAGQQQLNDTQQFGWVSSTRTPGVPSPANVNSPLYVHTSTGQWPVQLLEARNAAGVLQEYVKAAGGE